MAPSRVFFWGVPKKGERVGMWFFQMPWRWTKMWFLRFFFASSSSKQWSASYGFSKSCRLCQNGISEEPDITCHEGQVLQLPTPIHPANFMVKQNAILVTSVGRMKFSFQWNDFKGWNMGHPNPFPMEIAQTEIAGLIIRSFTSCFKLLFQHPSRVGKVLNAFFFPIFFSNTFGICFGECFGHFFLGRYFWFQEPDAVETYAVNVGYEF